MSETACDPLAEARVILVPLTEILAGMRAKQDRAGDLAVEVERLARAAEGLLRDAGLLHLMGESLAPVSDATEPASLDRVVAETFAAAHLAWADLINGLEALARAELAEAGQADDAHDVERMAMVLERAGQPVAAQGIRRAIGRRIEEIAEQERIAAEVDAELERRDRERDAAKRELARHPISSDMNEQDLREAIQTCNSVLQTYDESAVFPVSMETFELWSSVRTILWQRNSYEHFDSISRDGDVLYGRQKSLMYSASPAELGSVPGRV